MCRSLMGRAETKEEWICPQRLFFLFRAVSLDNGTVPCKVGTEYLCVWVMLKRKRD